MAVGYNEGLYDVSAGLDSKLAPSLLVYDFSQLISLSLFLRAKRDQQYLPLSDIVKIK